MCDDLTSIGSTQQARVGRRGVSRGALLIAAAVVVIALAGCSSPPPLHTEGARISHLTIASRFVHGDMGLTLVTPAGGGAHRPLLVFLHGVIHDNNSQLTDQLFTALHALGPRAPDIASPTATAPTGTTAPAAYGAPMCSTR
jgi:hypothetical protein